MTNSILRSADAAKLLGISLTTLWRLSQTEGFPPKICLTGRAVGFRERDLVAWLDSRQQGGELTPRRDGAEATAKNELHQYS